LYLDLIKSILLDKIILTPRAFEWYINCLNRLRTEKVMAQNMAPELNQRDSTGTFWTKLEKGQLSPA